jgi:hypothetical protein
MTGVFEGKRHQVPGSVNGKEITIINQEDWKIGWKDGVAVCMSSLSTSQRQNQRQNESERQESNRMFHLRLLIELLKMGSVGCLRRVVCASRRWK